MKDTAERLMDLAEVHIRRAGYAGFSFRDIAIEAGIRSASVHHHFPTKASMATAVATRYADRFFAEVAARPGETPEGAIASYRSAFKTVLRRDGGMCLFGILGAQAGGLSPDVAVVILDFFDHCIADLAARIGGDDAQNRAFQTMAALEGAMILANLFGDMNAFDQAVSALA